MTARYVADEAALREVVFAHLPNDTLSGYICDCGAHDSSDGGWADHLAAALLASGVVQPREDAVREANAGCFGRWPLDGQPVAAPLGPEHDGHALRLRSTGVTWEGDGEIETRRFTCSCGARVNVETRIDVGAPGTDRPAAEDGPRNTGTGSAT